MQVEQSHIIKYTHLCCMIENVNMRRQLHKSEVTLYVRRDYGLDFVF